ncbi:MAG: hypothetical protein U1E15_05920 [Hyphomicrobiales bacterium]
MQLIGSGFIVTPAEAQHLGLGKREGLERHIRLYRNGRDLTGTPREVMAIDLFGLEANEVRERFPEVYQHLLQTVKVQRDDQAMKSATNDAKAYAKLWWIFGKPRQELRPALENLPRYIATVETAKHRIFQFLDAEILPDNMIVCIASDGAFDLGVLSSRFHVAWALCWRLARHGQRSAIFKIPLLRPLPIPRRHRRATRRYRPHCRGAGPTARRPRPAIPKSR